MRLFFNGFPFILFLCEVLVDVDDVVVDVDDDLDDDVDDTDDFDGGFGLLDGSG